MKICFPEKKLPLARKKIAKIPIREKISAYSLEEEFNYKSKHNL